MKRLKKILNIDIEAIAVTVFVGGFCFVLGFFMFLICVTIPVGY